MFEDIINAFKIGVLNMHPGILPDNRGLDTIKWAIMKDMKQGVSCHLISKEIDRRPRKNKWKAVWKKPCLGFKVKPTFRITAVEEEKAILYAIKEQLGVGEVYNQKRTGNSKNVSNYCVQNLEELTKIEEFFKDKPFLTSKGNSFQLWAKC